MASFRQNFHTNLAKQFIDQIYYNTANLYYFLGKVYDDHGAVSTSDPDYAYANDIAVRDNITYLRKIEAIDVSLVIPFCEWEKDAVYDQWDNTVSMYNLETGSAGSSLKEKHFYVVNSKNQVFKCLNNGGTFTVVGQSCAGWPSTIEPEGEIFEPIKTDDGYTWKYLYTISEINKRKFLSKTWMPVANALFSSFYSLGSLESATVINGGAGYNTKNITRFTISSTASNMYHHRATIALTIGTGIYTGTIVKAEIVDPGFGYYYDADAHTAPTITINDPSMTGSGAVVQATVMHGKLDEVFVVNAGSGYSNLTSALVSEPPENHTRTLNCAMDSNGAIINVDRTDNGERYTNTSTLVCQLIDEKGTGTGRYGHSTAILTPKYVQCYDVEGVALYKLDTIVIEDPGKNYKNGTSTIAVVNGDGKNAQAVPIIASDGSVAAVEIIEHGEGYTWAEIKIVDSKGQGAEIVAVCGGNKTDSKQSIVEQLASENEGSIFSYVTTQVGTGYRKNTDKDVFTEVIIEGDGIGASAAPVFTEDGKLYKIIPTSYGKGYTWAKVTVRDSEHLSSDTDWSGYAILPPMKGHGHDAIKELYGHTICTYVAIRNEDSEISGLDQEYRQFGIISNVRNTERDKLATLMRRAPLFTLQLSKCQENDKDISDPFFANLIDEKCTVEIDDRTISHRVIKINAGEIKLQQISSIYKPIKVTDILTVKIGAEEYNFEIIGVEEPIINKYSGDLLTLAQMDQITVAEGHTVGIRCYITL